MTTTLERSRYPYELDADFAVYRLEEAGATVFALPGSGRTTRMRTSSIEIVRTAMESYGWSGSRIRHPCPAPRKSRAWMRRWAGSP